jgi:predicted nucleotidyltransferase
MDRPEFGFGDIKMAFEEKLTQGTKSKGINIEDILVLPAKLLQGTVKSATDLSKAVIDGTVAVGREITKAVIIDPFKKEKKE